MWTEVRDKLVNLNQNINKGDMGRGDGPGKSDNSGDY